MSGMHESEDRYWHEQWQGLFTNDRFLSTSTSEDQLNWRSQMVMQMFAASSLTELTSTPVRWSRPVTTMMMMTMMMMMMRQWQQWRMLQGRSAAAGCMACIQSCWCGHVELLTILAVVHDHRQITTFSAARRIVLSWAAATHCWLYVNPSVQSVN